MTHSDGRNLVGRVVHVGTDEGEPPPIGREGGGLGVTGQADQLADAGSAASVPTDQSWSRGLIVASGPRSAANAMRRRQATKPGA